MDRRLRDVNVGLQGGSFCASLIAGSRRVCLFTASFDCVCVILNVVLWEFWLRLNETLQEVHVRTFAPCRAFLFVLVVVFSSLENYFGFRTTNVRVKTDHSVSLRWKRFEYFQRGLYFSDNCLFDLWVDFVSSASPSFDGVNENPLVFGY